MEKETPVIAISEFKATCLKVLDQVKNTGEPIIVTKRGEPIACITPPPPPSKPSSWLGMFREQGRVVGDIVSPASPESDWEVLSG